MANDKDFVVNGPVVVGKDTKVTVGSIAAGTVDLSTGNYFVDSPSGDYTYTFANPGDVQAFQIQATGGSEAVAETFSTTLYTGNGTTQTIDNGLDLSGDGGLVWTKNRSNATQHALCSTETGVNKDLSTASDGPINNETTAIDQFNTDGYSISGNATNYNNSSLGNYASWTFRKAPKFFDIVTYTGSGENGQTITHDLGVAPGMVIVKCYTNKEKHT